MTKLEIELHDDIVSIVNKLKNINDTGIELVVPEGAVIFENVLNLKILKNWSDKEGKVINFMTDDINGQNLLMTFDEEDETPTIDANGDTTEIEEQLPKQKMKMPKFRFSLPTFSLGKKKFVILGIIIALLIFLGFLGTGYVTQLPEATVKVVVNSQPLTRSLELKVKTGEETSSSNKILKGETIEALVEDTLTIETTGEKIVGEKAEGEITIYNKTDEEKEFKKGTDIIYEDDDDNEYIYELKDDVTVDARVETPGPNPGDPGTFVNGSADVDVEATKIGDKYNIDEGEDLEVEDKDKDDFEAEVKKDIDGGKEETIKAVAQEDLDSIKEKLLENAEEKAVRALEESISKNSKMVTGSTAFVVVKEALSNVLDEEAEELTLDQTFSAKGLVYKPEELDKVIDEIVEDFVPQGFVLSTKERVVSVEILGNTDSTILNESEADLQVTLKTFVVPDISEDSIKESLLGKSISEAQKIIGSIRNIKTYEFNLSPRIPLLDFVPKDKDRINILIERE